METNNRLIDEAQGELESEVVAWDWVRAAGVSAEELRQALSDFLVPAPDLRKAA